MGARVVLTYRDYEALPADGRRYELHEGELSVMTAPGTQHQRVVGRLFVLLKQHVESRALGEVFVSPVDCILSEITVVQPDIVYVDAGHAPIVTARGIEGPPTLVVEILSPSTAPLDRGKKMQIYARHGVPHYWIVDLEARSVEAYALAESAFRPVARLDGVESGGLPPFPDLPLDSTSLWR
ncbi:MAG: Uma2 family endonuclease [Candidatus Rokubacteria bacterium]|nr:Uma2 family endonuclease [Candidatus Rokubacteria bacterium]